jgi:hypothetical protein
LLAFPAGNAMAALTYWDPQAKGTGGPTSGLWESAAWSTKSTGSTTLSNWVENTAAEFAYGTTGSTPAFTVTMNANHTVAGIFNGDGTTACTVTVNGSGTMTMPASTSQGFYVISPGVTTVNVPIAGSGTILIPEENGELVLNGANTYSGGTQIGFTSGTTFTGTLGFSTNASFGTGPVIFAFCPAFTLAVQGNSAVNLPNAFENQETSTVTCTIIGNPAGVTFSGPWNLTDVTGAANMFLSSGGATSNIVAISGVISGTNGINLGGPGIFVFGGANTYGAANSTPGSTVITSGTLVLSNASGSATGVSGVIVDSGATLTGNGTAT